MAGNPHIEEKHSAQMSVGAKMLRFPETVGMGPAFSTSAQTGGTVREAKPGQFPGTIDNRTYEFNWNSDEYSEQRGQTIDHRAHEPHARRALDRGALSCSRLRTTASSSSRARSSFRIAPAWA